MKKFQIYGLHCKSCSNRLEDALHYLPNGKNIKIDYAHEQITLDDSVNIEDVMKVLEAEKLSIISLEEKEETAHESETSEHGHHHHHHHHEDNFSTPGKMLIVFLLNLLFSIAEFIFGTLFKSSAILADALHDLGDSLSIGIAFVFEKISKKEADKNYSFGYARFSLLGALITSTVLIVGSIAILYQSIPKLFTAEAPNHQGMFWMAIIAIAVNGLSAWILRAGSSANERVLSLHVLEDMLGWIAVLIVSIVFRYVDWYFLDPLLSILIALFMLYNTVPEFLQAIRTFLNSTPKNVPVDEIEEAISAIDYVHAVNHLHIWSLDGESNAFSVTVFVHVLDGKQIEEIRSKIRKIVARHQMAHYTIEIIPDMNRIIG